MYTNFVKSDKRISCALTEALYSSKVLDMPAKEKMVEELYEAFLALRSPEEAKRFLRDLMTEEEVLECARRFWAARQLDQGVSYQLIQEQTGLSSTTVARISRWLKRGKDGYRLIIDRLHHTSLSREKRST